MIISTLLGLTVAWAAPLKIETSFSVLGDMAARVAGPNATIKSLVGVDSDVHAFEPSPNDIKSISGSNFVVMNGLGLDPWVNRLLKASGYQGEIVVVTDGAPLLRNDPHCWQDPLCGIEYVENIKKALLKLRPEMGSEIQKSADAFQKQIRAIFEKYKSQFDAIPTEKRKILTSHDSLAYFGRAYGVEIYTLRGRSTAQDTSAAELARLTKLIKEKNLKVAFFENFREDKALRQLAKDYGLKLGGTLFTDSLSKNPEGSTYLKMLEANASRVLEQLRGTP